MIKQVATAPALQHKRVPKDPWDNRYHYHVKEMRLRKNMIRKKYETKFLIIKKIKKLVNKDRNGK